MTRRWLFADQLGPHFLDTSDQPVLLVESLAVLKRRRFHRQKAHLVLSALRHRALELGDQAVFLQTETYREALEQLDDLVNEVDCVQPTSWAADDFVRRLGLTVQPTRGFATTREEFGPWAQGRRHLLMEDFYRWQRRRHDVLMTGDVAGDEPVGGTWNYDHDNREPPPKAATLGLVPPWTATEDDVDAQVREDLDRWERDGVVEFIGDDGPRWAPATRAESQQALGHFVKHRLPVFGPHEDAMLDRDPWMAHSALSPALNLGLLDPLECVHAAEEACAAGDVPIASAEGYVRQVLGWREWIWSIYWHVPRDYRSRNAMGGHETLPDWWRELDATEQLDAACLSGTMRDLRERGWVHHIPRLMVLSSWAMQRGYDPALVTDWFHRAFVDGYDWVMLPNVVGMSQHADGGLMATKPYTSGGAYIDRMSDYCGGCRYDPKKRVGDDACPFTAGYWSFLDRTAGVLEANRRMAQPLAGLARLKDREQVVAQERARGDAPP